MLSLVRFIPDIPLPSLFATLEILEQQRRQRLALRRLDRHLLDDIGLTRPEAISESKRSYWEFGTR